MAAFVTASLLFVVQPMIARLVLPHFGGAATVWSTTSLFFQLVLLAGYLYAHLGTNRMGIRTQAWVHAAVLAVPIAALPVALPSSPSPASDEDPALALLKVLALAIGLPFAVISTSGPLLQRWYSWTNGPRSHDPYFLYAASNVGSFVGLLAYPLAIEPLMSLDQQRLAWSIGFCIAAALLLACAIAAAHCRHRTPRPSSSAMAASPTPERSRSIAAKPSRLKHVIWFLLAFLPSTLMLGVTAHISTDIAAIPLMWIVPLALYLATFIAAFGPSHRFVGQGLARRAVGLAAVAMLSTHLGPALPVAGLIGLQLIMFTTVALTAHARLAAARPAAAYLTQFYLVVALGGAAGGLLNGLVAPVVFDRVWEYPLALLGSMLVGVGLVSSSPSAFLELRYGRRAAGVLWGLIYALISVLLLGLGLLGVRYGFVLAVVTLTVWTATGWVAAGRPLSLIAAMVVVTAAVTVVVEGGDIERSRTFYGSYQVKSDDGARVLVHGTTVHGTQRSGAAAWEPTTYYARSGPLGAVFAGTTPGRVAVVGMGAGTIAAYGTPDQTMTFYEIDPEIARLANDPQYFTYLSDSPADIRTVIGDGRLQLTKAPSGAFDLIVLDAFSSDSIPVHLLTEEAFATYGEKLAPGGVLAVHVSNRVFDLEPVVSNAADRLGWQAALGTGKATEDGATTAVWIAMSEDQSRIDALATWSGWRPLTNKHVRWTDNYSSVLTVLKASG
jgi:hypothetical protein